MSDNRTKDERPISAHRYKVSGTGWLCVFHRGKWLPVLQLTGDQLREFCKTIEALI